MKAFLRYSIVPFFVLLLIETLVFLNFNPEYRPVRKDEDHLQDYKKECLKIGGKPAWNGRHLECLQGSKT